MNLEPQSPGPDAPSAGHGAGQPRPFEEVPGDPPGGCSRPLLVGCALATVVAGMALLVLLWKAGDWLPALFRWSLETIEAQVMANLPPDLSEAERRRLADAFDLAAVAVEEGSADAAALQRLQGRLLEVARGGQLSREQVRELTEALEAVAGERAPPEPAAPPPAGGDVPMTMTRRGPPAGRLAAA